MGPKLSQIKLVWIITDFIKAKANIQKKNYNLLKNFKTYLISVNAAF